MKYTIKYESNPKQDDTSILWQGITENATLVRGHKPAKSFAFFIKDENDQIKGGCSGCIFDGCLYLDLLWVDALLRGKSFGTQLMEETEKLAKENKCHFIMLNTMDFEAPDFYKKLGYFVEFTRTGFEKDSSMLFFRKNLDGDDGA